MKSSVRKTFLVLERSWQSPCGHWIADDHDPHILKRVATISALSLSSYRVFAPRRGYPARVVSCCRTTALRRMGLLWGVLSSGHRWLSPPPCWLLFLPGCLYPYTPLTSIS